MCIFAKIDFSGNIEALCLSYNIETEETSYS